MKIDWKAKLSSRKFWALLAAMVVSCIVAFGGDPGIAEKITGIISAVGACAVYMLAEGLTDYSHAGDAVEGIELVGTIETTEDTEE